MTQRLPGRRALLGSGLALLCLLSAGPSVRAAQNPLAKLFGDKSTDYQIFKDPAGRFELEYPKKDWHLLPKGGSSLAVFARNDGPTLFVDQVKLSAPLTPEEIDVMADGETSRLKEQQPSVKEFKTEIAESRAGKGVLIRYWRIGQGAERVAQYSIPVGNDLYRLNGVIPEKLLPKHEPVVLHMIQSFNVPAAPASPKH